MKFALVFAFVWMVSSQALAVGIRCFGDSYRVSLSNWNDVSVASNGYLLAQGVAEQTDFSGWQYLAIEQNVAPVPADAEIDYTLIVPGIVGQGAFYGYLDRRFVAWGGQPQVTRSTLTCAPD